MQDATWLREQALKIVLTGEAILGSSSVFGYHYVIDEVISHQGMTALVRFCWVIEYGTGFPRLTTCYVM
jgi:hypothetical protein